MRIKVTGYLTLREVIGNQPFKEIEADSISVQGLLGQLSLEFGDDPAHIIPCSEGEGASRHIIVLVNGRHCAHLPDGLDTQLTEGDEVAIFPPVAGG